MAKALEMKGGDQFGFLILTGFFKWDDKTRERKAEVICICGKFLYITASRIIKGQSKSCGCKKSELSAKSMTKHGLSGVKINGVKSKKHPLYSIWDGIKARCLNSNSVNYSSYGGRGVWICPEWREDFSIFYNWCINNGWVYGLEVDRIDNNGGYEPDNCRIATRKMQCNNTRRTIYVEAFGERKPLMEWVNDDRCVVGKDTLNDRITHLKWEHEKALTKKSCRTKANAVSKIC